MRSLDCQENIQVLKIIVILSFVLGNDNEFIPGINPASLKKTYVHELQKLSG